MSDAHAPLETLPRSLNILLGAALLALAAFPFVGTDYYLQMVTRMMILAIFAMSLDLLQGVTGLVSLGHAAYFGIAGYALAFLTPEGALDRERMRAHVFSHPQAKQALEAIIHPLVSQETQQQAQAAISKGHRTLVFDVPLLVEAGERWRPQVDRILVVDCLEETQIQRVIARNGLSREDVQRIISAQASRVQKLAAADWVIYNNGISLDTLENQVNWLPIQAD